MKTRVQIARDVIAGYYGSGDDRINKLKKEGYDPDQVQGDVNTLLCCRENIIQNVRAMAVSIAANNNWWYIYWNEKYGHECAICHPHGGANHGWQCMGFVAACWHHGGIPSYCNCGIFSNEVSERTLAAKTDAEALKIMQNELGIKDIKVIRNGGKAIPKSWVEPGDAMILYDGKKCQHLVLNMSSTKVADSTRCKNKADDIRADRNFGGRYVSRLKVLVRYTGNGLVKPPTRTIDQLAYEVIAGLWGSGNSRKIALTQAGHDYDKVQKRVDEILNPDPTPTPPKKTPYTGEYPVVKKYLEKGDKGTEVTKLQNYLNWYTDGEFFKKCGKADGIYGDNTFKYTKKMQTAFFGKAEADGKVGAKTIAKMKAYSNSFKPTPEPTPTPTPSGKYTGEIPTLRLVKSNAQVKADACAWASWIAGDNRFHYGYGQHAHHNGCYFCGTQSMKKNHGIVDSEFTYCCNPFVGAAWAHGGCIPKAISLCQNCNSWDFNKGHGYDASSLFDKLGHPAKSKLKAGDVLCNGRHVALYLGNGKLAEASGGDDNKKNSAKWNNSIHVITMSDSKYNSFDRVYRYNGKVDADIVMRHGECSDRVMQWQKFLDWYFDGEFTKQCGAPDRFFGDNTLKWTKKFQEKEFGKKEADGLCGNKTFGRAKEITK